MPDHPQETTKQKLVKQIVDARNTLRAAKLMEGYLQKSASSEAAINQEIINESVTLIKEAFALGAKGQTCPACNGSGRV